MYKSGITRQEVHDNKVNIIFAVIGAILIVLARFPYGVSWGENVLDSIGCGCISASIISIFMYKQQKSNKYSLPTVEAMSDTQLEKLHKMVQIIVSSSTGTLEQCKQLDNNKVVLDSEGLIPIETIEKNAANVGIAFTILCAKGKKNYGLAYSLIFQVLLSLRAIGGFTNDYSISLQGRIKAGEL